MSTLCRSSTLKVHMICVNMLTHLTNATVVGNEPNHVQKFQVFMRNKDEIYAS